jgi:hypothetical protein
MRKAERRTVTFPSEHPKATFYTMSAVCDLCPQLRAGVAKNFPLLSPAELNDVFIYGGASAAKGEELDTHGAFVVTGVDNPDLKRQSVEIADYCELFVRQAIEKIFESS